MTDLPSNEVNYVEALRRWANDRSGNGPSSVLLNGCADYIERLERAVSNTDETPADTRPCGTCAGRGYLVQGCSPVKTSPRLLGMGDPIPEGGCGCRENGVPVMRAQCRLHGSASTRR